MNKLNNYLFSILFLIPILLGAQSFVYTPTNPSFIGGSPFNAQSLLSSAQAQNKFKEPNALNTQKTDLQNFKESLNRQLLDRLSTSLFDQQFGNKAITTGTYKFGSLVVDVGKGSDGLNIGILDIGTGAQTQISLPNF